MTTSKVFSYAVSLDEDGGMHAEGGTVSLPEGWAADHLAVGAVLTCSLGSLRYHARRAGMTVRGHGEGRATVAKRPDDGRFAIVEMTIHHAVSFDPEPAADVLPALFAKAERDCFVGASLRARPVYRWTVDGVEVEPAAATTAAG